MIVIATSGTIDPALMQTITFPKETFNVAVFTNSQTTSNQEVETAGIQVNERPPISSVCYIAAFVALLTIIQLNKCTNRD